MLAENLAQKEREAVFRRLREDPDCPNSHLVNKAIDQVGRPSLLEIWQLLSGLSTNLCE